VFNAPKEVIAQGYLLRIKSYFALKDTIVQVLLLIQLAPQEIIAPEEAPLPSHAHMESIAKQPDSQHPPFLPNFALLAITVSQEVQVLHNMHALPESTAQLAP